MGIATKEPLGTALAEWVDELEQAHKTVVVSQVGSPDAIRGLSGSHPMFRQYWWALFGLSDAGHIPGPAPVQCPWAK